MPPTEVELGHCHKALDRVVDLGEWEKCFRVGHEAVLLSVSICKCMHRDSLPHLVMRSSMDRGSSMNVGSVTRLRSAPGRNCDIM